MVTRLRQPRHRGRARRRQGPDRCRRRERRVAEPARPRGGNRGHRGPRPGQEAAAGRRPGRHVTITNPGGDGTFHGTPVISPPQAAILGSYAWSSGDRSSRTKLGRDVVAIRSIMNITLTSTTASSTARYAGSSCATCAAPGDLGRERLPELDLDGHEPTPDKLVDLGCHAVRGGGGSSSARSRPSCWSGARPGRVVLLKHPPVVTLGRRTEEGRAPRPRQRLHRGGRDRPRQQVDVHAPGQLICYPILDLNRHGRDVKRSCRELEEALDWHARARSARGTTRSTSSAASGSRHRRGRSRRSGTHLPLGDDARLHAERRSRSRTVHEWVTACRLEDAAFTTMARELGRPGRSPRCVPPRPPRARGSLRPRARRASTLAVG